MSEQVGLFLNPVAQRRVDFQGMCGGRFARLYLADGIEQAGELLAQQRADLLIIDLERFDRTFDLASIGALIAARGGAPTLLLMPFTHCGWLPDLQKYGPAAYAITPISDDDLLAAIDAQLAATPAPSADPQVLLAARDRLQTALATADDTASAADQICAALSGYDGVMHAALFLLAGEEELHLAAQQSTTGFNLVQILNRAERLLQSPLRYVFPGLLAACTGEMSLLDSPAKAGDPELALTLLDKGVEMIVGVPLGGDVGALCLMFSEQRVFAPAEIAAFSALAQLAGVALSMEALRQENKQLRGQLAHLSTIDALTGASNRRHGEHLLEQEIKRARRYKAPVALIAFDIDRFKAINDQFGHPVGDVALHTVAEVTRTVMRANDILVRSGGQEFQVIVPHTSAIDALKMAEKLRVAVAEADIPGCDRVTISLGVAQIADQESADALAVRAATALARAKRAGRNCVELAML